MAQRGATDAHSRKHRLRDRQHCFRRLILPRATTNRRARRALSSQDAAVRESQAPPIASTSCIGLDHACVDPMQNGRRTRPATAPGDRRLSAPPLPPVGSVRGQPAFVRATLRQCRAPVKHASSCRRAGRDGLGLSSSLSGHRPEPAIQRRTSFRRQPNLKMHSPFFAIHPERNGQAPLCLHRTMQVSNTSYQGKFAN